MWSDDEGTHVCISYVGHASVLDFQTERRCKKRKKKHECKTEPFSIYQQIVCIVHEETASSKVFSVDIDKIDNTTPCPQGMYYKIKKSLFYNSHVQRVLYIKVDHTIKSVKSISITK